MRLTELIAKLQRLPPSATVELHNGKAWVKCGETSYRPLDEYAREPQASPLLSTRSRFVHGL